MADCSRVARRRMLGRSMRIQGMWITLVSPMARHRFFIPLIWAENLKPEV